jgi:hypothetical protein
MKKLTKKQRHEIYKKALESYGECEIFLCNHLSMVVNKEHECSEFNYPELYLFTNPETDKLFLSDHIEGTPETTSIIPNGILFRQLILMFCIEMTR